MGNKRIHTALGASMGILLLILDSRTALNGAAQGLKICISTVIPSLLPFFVLSILLTGSLTGQQIPILRPLEKLTGIPEGSGSILLTGFLGGYPVGAQAVSAAKGSGSLTGTEASRMLAFCSNAGPAFIFGIAAALFPAPWMGWVLWGIHIVSGLLVAVLLPKRSQRKILLKSAQPPTLPGAVSAAVKILAGVCGWVIIFRVVLAILERWLFWLMPEVIQVVLTGLLELANGCCALAAIQNVGLRFLVCSGILAFGGLCVGMQTISVAENVDRRLYFPGKLLQTYYSILLSLSIQALLPDSRLEIPAILPLLMLPIPAIFLLKGEKSSSIPVKAGV